MKPETSGKIYRFKLHCNFGYGFSEIYDFTDDSMFDGRIAYVYNKIEVKENIFPNIHDLRNTGIALGPIRLSKFPNVRGLHSWKYIFQTNDLLITDYPETKELRGLYSLDNNWDNLKDWYGSNYDIKQMPKFVPYSKVRHLETRIINPPTGIVKKFSMKRLLDTNKKVSDYYDLSDLGNKNMFVQLINTYYSLEETKSFLNQIPK